MSEELVPASPGITALAPLKAQARGFIALAKAPSTMKAYRTDWRHFCEWCEASGLVELPAIPETVALYLTSLAATHRPMTMNRRLTAITKAHQAAGYPSPASMQHPAVGETLKGIRRVLGTAQSCKTPALTVDIRSMVDALPCESTGIRDRAILLMGFAGGFRRSEIAALDCRDVLETEEGLVITLRRSKTDQEGRGRKVALPYGSTPGTCPVRCYRSWLRELPDTDGPLFRGISQKGQISPKRLHKDIVGRIVKRAALAAGLDPALYAGHSLRSGLATQAYLNGANELSIMKQTGHRSLEMVRRYIRDASLFRDNPAAKLGL